jgi:hypothetical protein
VAGSRNVSKLCLNEQSTSRAVRKEEFVYLNAESFRQPLEVVQRNVARLSLDMRDKGSVQARLECQRFLRPPLGSSK